MKKNRQPRSILKLTVTLLCVAGFFALLVSAFLVQWKKYEGRNFELLRGSMKYVFIAGVFLLLSLLFTLSVITSTRGTASKLITPAFFGVDFKKDEEEKKPLKSVEASDRLEEALSIAKSKSDTVYIDKEGRPITAEDRDYSSAAKSVAAQRKTDPSAEEENEGGSRFYMLTEIDKEYELYVRPEYDDGIGLRELCEVFRNFAAGKPKLYYDIEDIRRFIGALAVTKLIILQGMSGTGKTSLAYAFGEFLNNKTVVVPIQPMWKERTDLVGYYNEFTRRFNETTLLYKMYEANCNEEIYVTVLDEMNIARVEYYFAEFLSLLEIPNPDGRNLDVVADRWEDDPKLLQHNGKLRLPTNMWFVGTANNDDSTFSISDKVYDRAMVLNLDKKAVPFDAPNAKNVKLSSTHLEDLFARAQREFDISDRNLRRIKKLDEYMVKTFHITFGNRIMKQIRSYVPVLVACGGTELEALDDILSRKVFRKLESKNPVYVKQAADGLCSYLDELFGEDKMPLCKESVRLIEQNI